MKPIFPIILLAAGLSFAGCQKQTTVEERRAEVERQVRERLATEHQQQQANELSQREGELNAREQALRNQATPAATIARETRTESETTTTRERESERGRPTGSYSTFYTKLEPYGDWIDTHDYGYVYHPREASGPSWRPYTNGRWVYTDAGWTWVSDEPFGWATYHYGRWTRLRSVGWVWVPGDQWAPAWVSWRKGGDYVGWAPLPPEARFERRTGIHNWSDSYYDIGPAQYSFVTTRQFGEQRIERAIVPEQQNVTIVQQTTNVTNITYNNNTVINNGPSYDELRSQSSAPIERLRIERETTVQADPRSVVRGAVITITAPVIAPQAQERPRAVRETLAQTSVDLGWSGVNQGEADKMRAKNRSEATPPPNAPEKKFARVSEAATSVATPVAAASATVPATNTPAPTATILPSATPVATATSVPVASPTPTPTLAPTPLGLAHPSDTPTPAPARTVATAPEAVATVPSTATPFMNRREEKEEKREMRREQRFNPSPAASPSASLAAPANESATSTPMPFLNRKDERRAEKQMRRGVPQEVSSPAAAPAESSASATESPATEASASPVLTKRELKQERRAEKRAARAGATNEPESSPTP